MARVLNTNNIPEDILKAITRYGATKDFRMETRDDLETLIAAEVDRVKLPQEFAATKYPGYFWNVEKKELYSIKIDGILKPLKKIFPNSFNILREPGYRVSVRGHRKFLPMSYLQKLRVECSEIPTNISLSQDWLDKVS